MLKLRDPILKAASIMAQSDLDSTSGKESSLGRAKIGHN
jgi:hypothetical protein